MTQEALKMALYYLEQSDNYLGSLDHSKPIAAIKEALAQPDPYKQGYADAMNWKVQNHLEHLPTAQPEQEPVAYWKGYAKGLQRDYDSLLAEFQAQRTWVGLTDEEYAELAEEFGPFPINQIEAKLKEKNT